MSLDLELILGPLRDAADAGEPRQSRLYRLLKASILDGRLAPGTRLPASRHLATDYRMARNGVLFAYQQLLAEGFLEADRQGTRVAALPLAAGPAPATRVGPEILSRRGRQLPRIDRGDAALPFAPGIADLNAFPWQRWARLLQQAWGEVSARQLASTEPGGEPTLRRAVAAFLSARRGVACAPEQVFIVAGGQVALDACAHLLADEGDTVWMEEPGYPHARNTMLAAGLRVQGVPVDQDGMAPDEALWQATPPRLLFLTPSHQYPLGSVLSLERRLALLNRLTPGGWLIEDDYDSDFNHAQPGARPLPAIQGLRPDAPVIYVGTFSKLLYPGLRIGYMVVPRWAVTALGDAIGTLYRSGRSVEQRALARFLDSGELTRHLRRMAPVYRARQLVLRDALSAEFGTPEHILGGQAGLHLVLRLPDVPDDVAVAQAARELGVIARPLSSYYADRSTAGNGLVLGYGAAEEGRIPELVARLRVASTTARAIDGSAP